MLATTAHMWILVLWRGRQTHTIGAKNMCYIICTPRLEFNAAPQRGAFFVLHATNTQQDVLRWTCESHGRPARAYLFGQREWFVVCGVYSLVWTMMLMCCVQVVQRRALRSLCGKCVRSLRTRAVSCRARSLDLASAVRLSRRDPNRNPHIYTIQCSVMPEDEVFVELCSWIVYLITSAICGYYGHNSTSQVTSSFHGHTTCFGFIFPRRRRVSQKYIKCTQQISGSRQCAYFMNTVLCYIILHI